VVGTPSPGGADIYGTINYSDVFETHSDPDEPQSDSRHEVVDTVQVLLKRDPNGSGIEYIDAGSTYSSTSTFRGVNVFGIPPCESITTQFAEVHDAKFGVPNGPAPPSTITALIDRDLGFFVFNIDLAYPYAETVDDCGQHIVVDTSNSSLSGSMGCGFFGLTAKLIEVPNGPDQLDMACTLTTDGGATTVSGILTIAD
jgi:hypothetical protein